LLNESDSVQIAPDELLSWIDMSIAMPRFGWIGPCTACAVTIAPRVWYAKRSTVCAAWCHSRWSVHERGWPSALMFVRRKKKVCTSICWRWSSPARILRRTHWWLGLKRRVWPTIATLPDAFCAASTASASFSESASGIST
jgi:hypothetical protein